MRTSPKRVFCLLPLVATASALLFLTTGWGQQTIPLPQSQIPTGVGTPGALDREFRSFLHGQYEVRFVGTPDIRTATLQPDGKILIGGKFQIQARGINYSALPFPTSTEGQEAEALPDGQLSVNVTWRNIARLNSDGTLDVNFISQSIVNLLRSKSSAGEGTEYNVTWGPDGSVFSILIGATGSSFQYIIGGDFLNFSHGPDANPVVRNRFLVLQGSAFNQNAPTSNPQPLVQLTGAVAGGFGFNLGENAPGFNGAVRELRSVLMQGPPVHFVVADEEERVAENFPQGTFVFQQDDGQYYQKVEPGNQPEAWQSVDFPEIRQIFLAAGDFTSFAGDPRERYLIRLNMNPFPLSGNQQVSVPTVSPLGWNAIPVPNRRVWDMAAVRGQIFFVGEFDTVQSAIPWNRIGAMNESGLVSVGFFNPGTGFNDAAYGIVADPEEDSVVVVGQFTDYDGNTVGGIARVDQTGAFDPSFPAPNNGNDDGANGVIRSITRQPDGRLMIAGDFTRYNGIPRSGIARLEPDGSLDLTFTPSGTASGIIGFARDVSGGPGTASLFARPVVVGNFIRLFGTGFSGVARFVGGSYPVIWFQPNQIQAPHVANLGGQVTLSVVATDNFQEFPGLQNPPFVPPVPPSEPLLYQWQRNGRDIQGAVNPVLNLRNLQRTDAANYRVRIYNSRFSIFSDPVAVTVNNPFVQELPPRGIVAAGIIEPNNVLNGGMGGSVDFRINRLGGASGRIILSNPNGPPFVYRFVGQYDFETGMTVEIPRANQSPLTLQLRTDMNGANGNFDFTGFDNILSDGTGQSAQISAWNASWDASRPATQYGGTYNIAFETDPADLSEIIVSGPVERPKVSQGFGICIMRVHPVNGFAHLSGFLADGSRFVARSFVWGDGAGTVPLYAPLYGSRGSLSGELNIEIGVQGNPILAELFWSKPSGVPRSPDVFGFQDVLLNAAPGSGIYFPQLLPPPPFFLTMEFEDGAWAGLPGAPEPGIFFQDFEIIGNRAITDPDFNPQAVRMAFNGRTGFVSGRFLSEDSTGRSRVARFLAIVTAADGFPEIKGYYILPNQAGAPEFFIGGSVQGF